MLISMNDPKFEQNREDYLQLHIIYAHGELENKLGFDIVVTNSISVYNQLQLAYPEDDKINLQTIAMDENGNTYDVIVYAWRVEHDRIKGYAILKGDTESIKFAKTQQQKKPLFI